MSDTRPADPGRLVLWKLRYVIQRAFGLDCEWKMEPRPKGGFVARCRWCGAYKAKERA